jgi:hypothetical protein
VTLGLAAEATAWSRDVFEGLCPVCHCRLVPHDGIGCCRCCGGAYSADPDHLSLGTCELHRQDCEHWQPMLTMLRALASEHA